VLYPAELRRHHLTIAEILAVRSPDLAEWRATFGRVPPVSVTLPRRVRDRNRPDRRPPPYFTARARLTVTATLFFPRTGSARRRASRRQKGLVTFPSTMFLAKPYVDSICYGASTYHVERRPMITPAQCRAARALLDWSQRQLASAAQIGVSDVGQFERSGAQRRPAIMNIVRRTLEAGGIEFIAENGGGPGVRLRRGAGGSRVSAG
jgi:hypothetical protein